MTWVLKKEDNTQSCAHPSHESPWTRSLRALGALGRVQVSKNQHKQTGAGEQLLKCTVSPIARGGFEPLLTPRHTVVHVTIANHRHTCCWRTATTKPRLQQCWERPN